MWAIAGLGNPGEEYSGTRHNVGFEVVRELARRAHLRWKDTRLGARIAEGPIAGEPAVLIEPQLYMNRSGDALKALKIGVDPASLIVIHDDVDLPLGRIRIKRGGGSGGHRGVESIAEHFGAAFTRVRLGIGRPELGTETPEYVLSRFEEGERKTVAATVREAADAVQVVIEQGTEAAMSRFNVRRLMEQELTSIASPTAIEKE